MMIDLESVQNFLKWADIGRHGLVETNALAMIDDKYVRIDHQFSNGGAVPSFAERHSDTLITVGVNPRQNNQWGAAKDKDILVYQNLYLDIEPIHAPNTNVTEDQRLQCYEFANSVMNGFQIGDLWRHIVQAESGNGMHLLIAIPPYSNPQEFGNKLQTWYKTVLLPESKKIKYASVCRIDSTFSPSRQCKLYGTKKPIEGARLSSFPNVQRVESADFRDYILSFPEKPRKQVTVDFDGGQSASTLEEIETKYNLRDRGWQ